MKKYLFLLLPVMAILLMPTGVSAKSKCEVVSGTGKNIGDEIACGSEHFYVVDSGANETKMLSKYNLYYGYTNHRTSTNVRDYYNRTYLGARYEELTDGTEIMNAKRSACQEATGIGYYSYDNNYVMQRVPAPVDGFYRNEDTDDPYVINCYYYTYSFDRNHPLYGAVSDNSIIEVLDDIRQDETALSAHSDPEDKNKFGYPQVGDYYVISEDMSLPADFTNPSNGDKYDGKFFDVELSENGDLGRVLGVYKNTMTSDGYEAKNVDLMSLSDLEKIISAHGKKSVSYSDWWDNKQEMNGKDVYAFLQDYVPEGDSWLYTSTYWLKNKTHQTITQGDNSQEADFYLFVDAQGAVCGSYVSLKFLSGRSCYFVMQTVLPAGIRPMVTFDNADINFRFTIKTKTDGNGTIEAQDSAKGDEAVTFKVIANPGFALKSLKLTSDNGEEVVFEEKDVIKNEDGTISIRNNKFTMPFDNVTIEASWEKIGTPVSVENPDTAAATPALFFVLFGALSAVIGLVVKKRLG